MRDPIETILGECGPLVQAGEGTLGRIAEAAAAAAAERDALLADYRRVRAALGNIAHGVLSGELTLSMMDQGTKVTCNIDNALTALDDCPER